MRRTAVLLQLLLSLCIPLTGYAGTTVSGRITVKISGMRSDSGEVRVNLYNSKEGFPSEPRKAFLTIVSGIKSGEAEVVFEDIPFGDYAISVMHDENGNKKMDFNWLMIPKEGVGASNNPRGFFPPSFDDARFRLGSEELTVRISVRY